MSTALNASQTLPATTDPQASGLRGSMGEVPMEPVSPEFEPHFEGLAHHEIRLPCCGECGQFHWYPMPRCPHCQSSDVRWTGVDGPARLYSWTVVRHAFQPALRGTLPYVVALVTFDDAPRVRLITNLVKVEPADIHVGMVLRPVFDNPADARPRVQFRPA